MKVHMFEKKDTPDFVEAIEMQGPLILSDTNVLDVHASTKKFVDEQYSTGLDAEELVGTLNVKGLRAFGGDVRNTAGSNTFKLKDVNPEIKERTMTVVNEKGLVVGGGELEAKDIPRVTWNQVVNAPTSLEGMGIKDAVKITGDTVEDEFKYNGSSEGDLNPINKHRLETKIAEEFDEKMAPIGSVLISTDPVTPPGYLRMNGARVKKSMYPELYSKLEELYHWKDETGGKPWKNQYEFNEATGIGAWVQDTNLPIKNGYHQCVVTKDRLYMIGGHNGSSILNTVYYAPILEDGSLGTWVQDNDLPITNHRHECVVTKNRLYMIGGYNGSSYFNTVYYAPILEDGSLGTWVQDSNIPINNRNQQCVVTKNRLYMIGGYNGSSTHNQVYYAPILEDGSLGTWVQDTNLPIYSRSHQCVVTKNRLYMIGGVSDSSYLNTVYYAPILEDGSLGTWVQDSNLPQSRPWFDSIVTSNRVYIAGGSTNTVYYAPINEDGSLGAWVQDTNLPITNSHHQFVVTKNRLYMIGGTTTADTRTTHNQVYYAPLIIPEGKEGGKNDYSEHYSLISAPSDMFNLPTPRYLKKGSYAYIRAF